MKIWAEESCQLLGPISILIQLFMGVLAVGVLLLKRNYEYPKRTWVVWFYDLGKQVIGALCIHFLNVLISLLKSQQVCKFWVLSDHDDVQCDWYFMNLLMDTTVGIPMIWVLLRLINRLMCYLNVSNIESGNYYPSSPASGPYYGCASAEKRPLFTAFIKQLLVFITSLCFMKLCIYIILDYFSSAAYVFANLILSWSDPWPNFQVFLVMFVAPVTLNCFQYLCIDNIIKLPSKNLEHQNSETFDRDLLIHESNTFMTCSPVFIRTNYRSLENN